MKTVLKVFVAAIVVIGSALSLGVKFWADGERVSTEGPSLIHITPSNELSVLIDETIYIFDKYGDTKGIIELSTLNIDSHGDYAFFSDGDLLVYNSENKPSFLDNIARFLRLKEYRQGSPEGKNGLYRCNLSQNSCGLFTTKLPEFHSSFRLYIDIDSDDVYISDGPRFALYKLDQGGNLLAKNNNELKFPNKLFIKEDNLYVANTNYHEIKVVSANTKNFGELIDRHKATLNFVHRWPADMTFDGDNWWVLISDDEMANAKLNVYDDRWEQKISPKLPQNADPIGIEYFDYKFWVADWRNFRIYRFLHDGTPLDDFTNTELDIAYTTWNEKTDRFRSLSRNGLISFITLLIFGFVAAFILEKKKNTEPKFESDSTKGYFNNLANSAFKDNPNGEGWLYYPNGILSKGRIVLDIKYKEKLFNFQKYIYMLGIPLGVIYGLSIDFDRITIYTLFPPLVFIVVFYSIQYLLIKNLEVSNVKLKYKEATSKAMQGLPSWYCYLLYSSSLLIIIIGLSIPLIFNKTYSEVLNLILLTVGMGVVGMVVGRLVQKYQKLGRPNE